MKEFRGIPVSPGVTIGKVFLLDDVKVRVPKRPIAAWAVEQEQLRLKDALAASGAELAGLRQQAEQSLGAEAAAIFAFHQGMLMDKKLTGPMLQRIADEKVTAEYAAQEGFRELADKFASMSETFAAKVDDVWDLDHRLLKHLIGAHRSAISRLDKKAVVIAPELTPSQASAFPKEHVQAFVTDMGGQTSHTAIFARALGIPAVMGTGLLCEAAEEGDDIIVDGDNGTVILRPDKETLELYRGYIKQAEVLAVSLHELTDLVAQTTDGVRIELLGNIEFAEEIKSVLHHGGDGVGLFRTEFLWLTSDHEPTEEEQYEEYRKAVELAAGRTLTIRTFDLGADKYTQERAMAPERNPFLGLRSIRYCLQNTEMFKRQLRAILRASVHGPMKMMFPLLTNTMELRKARMIMLDVMEDLAEEGVHYDMGLSVGMMVETPSAALMAQGFAREVAFFSIGTNDLVQYTLAVDRTNEKVASLYSPAHPAVIRLIKEVVRAAKRQGIPVSCCGEVAGDPEFTMLLIGLGLRSLSVTPSRIPYIKRVVRRVDMQECEKLARTVGSLDSERQVIAYLRDQARRYFPESYGGRSADQRLER